MPENQGSGERTEPATPRKRQEARKKGQVAKSQEVNFAVILLASVLGLYFMAKYLLGGMADGIIYYCSDLTAFEMTPVKVYHMLLMASWQVMRLFLPFALMIAAVGFASNVLQIGFLASSEALAPKLDRLNPISGLSRIFSWRGIAELFKSIGKVSAISWVCYYTIKRELVRFFVVSFSTTEGILTVFGQVAFLMAIRCVLIMLVIAVLDFAFQRWQYEKNLRMSVQELREEMKELYGDPQIRARVKQIQREMAQRRMMEKVPEAEVVITNPTHYAVALLYNNNFDAPMVVAKGKNYIAQKIRQVAQECDVPIVEDPVLARSLYNSVELNQFIPEALYQAVAKVLAYVYGLKNKIKKQNLRQSVRTG